ncbi:DUF5995 family protein [Pedococcus bigeumensis]|uniref:Uncharacterized protein n=1 Tax=Pedococcus bigeumensis TaxID=433644 RepID=A0A502CMJ9_9MICO|nr:DUF5995 family protein [Pedococcus bigeumensis]TPG14002.1 hypothetical protein EAH86_17485 [Pedococcus bigeumensis]
MGWFGSVVRRVRKVLAPTRPIAVPPGQAASVPEVVERLRRVGAGLGPGDGVGHFNAVYLLVTERVGDRLAAHAFVNPAFLERLDVVFAGLYLEAVEASDDGRSKAWTPLFESRAATGLLPVQFAVAGMNAHINHDLPIATVRTCRQLGLSPSSPGVQHDYLTINAVLAEVHEEVRQSLLDETERRLDHEISPVLNLVGSWSVSRARDAAWQQALVLWELQSSPTLTRTYLDSLASSVGLVSRQLLVALA